MPNVKVSDRAINAFLDRMTEVTILYDRSGRILGTWVPAGSPPPANPPEPPTASAAVGARIPKNPPSGAPGAAAIYLSNPSDEEVFGILPSMSTAYRDGSE